MKVFIYDFLSFLLYTLVLEANTFSWWYFDRKFSASVI